MRENVSELSLLRDEKEQLQNEVRSLYAASEQRTLTADEQNKFDELEARSAELDSKIGTLERAERAKAMLSGKRSEVFGAPVIKVNRKATPEDYHDAFKAWALNTAKTRNKIADNWKRSADLIQADWTSDQWQLRAQSSDVAGEGVEFINDGVYRGFVEAKQAYGGILSVANVQELPTAESTRYVTDNDTANVAGVLANQNTPTTNTSVANIDEVTISPSIYSTAVMPVSLQLIRDGKIDVPAWIGRKLSRRLLKKINVDLTAALESGSFLGTQGLSNNLNEADLGDLFFSVDPDYAVSPRAAFMGNYATLHHLWSQFIDPNVGPTWGDGLNASPMRTILGQRYVVNQQCDTMVSATPAKPLFFGDFDAMVVHTVGQPTLLRANELYMEKLAVGFLMYWEVDGAVVDAGTHPIKYLETGVLSGE